MIVWVPTELGVKVTEQVDWLVVVGESVQLEGVKLPLPLVPKVTVPVGAVLVPAAVSFTVAVQTVSLSTGTLAGVQLTVVEVARLATLTVALP